MIKKRLSTVVSGNIIHDPDSVAEAIIEIICDDLKFRDESFNTDFVMLKSRLKKGKNKTVALKKQKNEQTKNLERQKKQMGKHTSGKKSKFQSKYSDRIVSIKTSEEKRQERLKSLGQDKRK